MKKSNRLNASPKKCHAPRPMTLTETSRKKNAVKQASATTKPRARGSSMPWCSMAIVAVFKQITHRKNVLNLGCSAVSRHSALNSTHRRRRSSDRRSAAVISAPPSPSPGRLGAPSGDNASSDRASLSSPRSASSRRARAQRETRRLTRYTSVARVLVLREARFESPDAEAEEPTEAFREERREATTTPASPSASSAPPSPHASSSRASPSSSRGGVSSPAPSARSDRVSLARKSACARPNFDFRTARNRLTTKYEPKKTSATK